MYRWVRGCGGQRAGVQVGEGVWGRGSGVQVGEGVWGDRGLVYR